MYHPDVQVIRTAQQWAEAQPVWLCTVLSTYGSSPRPPGAMMVIRADGRYSGSLSGGCVEENFITRVQQQAFSAASQLVRYGEGATRLTARCRAAAYWIFWSNGCLPVPPRCVIYSSWRMR